MDTPMIFTNFWSDISTYVPWRAWVLFGACALLGLVIGLVFARWVSGKRAAVIASAAHHLAKAIIMRERNMASNKQWEYDVCHLEFYLALETLVPNKTVRDNLLAAKSKALQTTFPSPAS